MKHLLKLKNNQRGSILLVFIITVPFLILIALYYTQLALTSAQVARFDQLGTEAQLTADAGADYAVQMISENNAWTGTGGEVELHDDGSVRTTYDVTVTGDDNAKTIAVTGRTYWPTTSSTPRRTTSIYVDLRPVTTGNYSVVTGAGGLYMSNNSKIVSGSVFINGELVMSNSASIGLSSNPVDVKVAHKICPIPANATFPQLCGGGYGQPISINNTAHIYGSVQANNQTSGSGMSNPGLQPGSVTPQDLPTYDRAAQKAATTGNVNNLTGAQASCSGSQSKTWEANIKITGDVTMSNSCTIRVKGDVWITGRLEMSNTTKLIIDNSVGTTRPDIMVDGSNGVRLSNSTEIVSNNVGTGANVYTFHSTDTSCRPDCANVTGTYLSSSRSLTTIEISNSAAAANTVFYAYWTRVRLSNGGAIGAVIGQTIEMSNTAAITFGASASTGNTIWVVKGYREQ